MSLIIKGMDMPKKGVYHAVITFDGDSLGVRIPPSKEPFFSGRIVHNEDYTAPTVIEAENSSAIDDDVKKYCDYLKSETYDFCNRIENGEVNEG